MLQSHPKSYALDTTDGKCVWDQTCMFQPLFTSLAMILSFLLAMMFTSSEVQSASDGLESAHKCLWSRTITKWLTTLSGNHTPVDRTLERIHCAHLHGHLRVVGQASLDQLHLRNALKEWSLMMVSPGCTGYTNLSWWMIAADRGMMTKNSRGIPTTCLIMVDKNDYS